MRPLQSLCVCLLLASTALSADSKHLSDYPLRIHIFHPNQQTTFYHQRYAEESKGEGRANLFENDQVHGVDFSFDCSNHVTPSLGYETYPARWKKPNQELIVLFPVFGKSNDYYTCHLQTDVKDLAYVTHNGAMTAEPPAQFKAWMARHDYDPEHGKDMPTNLTPRPATP